MAVFAADCRPNSHRLADTGRQVPAMRLLLSRTHRQQALPNLKQGEEDAQVTRLGHHDPRNRLGAAALARDD
jgi:hypothetical protein